MAKKITTTKSEARSAAKQRHEAIREFLNVEPTRTDILAFIREKTGDGNELKVMKALLESNGPILNEDISKIYLIAKSTTSKIANNLDEYIRLYSTLIEPLKVKRKTICIPRQDGGNNIGYHFACFDNNTKEYLDGLVTEKLFENLWDDFIKSRLCEILATEANEDLSKKLGGRDDYQVLGMEIASLPKGLRQDSDQESMICDYNRKWEPFNHKTLIESKAFYIITNDAGRGKTTLLRYLQLEFLQKTELIPVFLDASMIQECNPSNCHQFANMLAKHYDLKLPEKRVIYFIEKEVKGKIVLLIDGLDQTKAGGREFESTVNHISHIIGNNVIMASRPTAVVNLECDTKFRFIRLMPFDVNAQIAYFGKHYERASELSYYSPYLLSVPMLAYMVRLLIENKDDNNINNNSQLYQKFIDYILMEYKHGKTRLTPDLRTQIRDNLGKIAYFAMTEKRPHIQKIPICYCYEKNILSQNLNENGYESLTQSGLVNIIAEKSGFARRDYLFFTHQSFQEYLAAEWASRDRERVLRILDQAKHKIHNDQWSSISTNILKFVFEINEGLIEEIYFQWKSDESDYMYLAIMLYCINCQRCPEKIRRPLFNSIIQAFKIIHFQSPTGSECFTIYLYSMTKLDPQRSCHYIFQWILDCIHQKNGWDKLPYAYLLSSQLSQIKNAHNQIDKIIDESIKIRSLKYVLPAMEGEAFGHKHISKVIDYIIDNIYIPEIDFHPLILCGSKIETSHLNRLCEFLDSAIYYYMKEKVLDFLINYSCHQKLKQNHLSALIAILDLQSKFLANKTVECLLCYKTLLKKKNVEEIVCCLEKKCLTDEVYSDLIRITRNWLVKNEDAIKYFLRHLFETAIKCDGKRRILIVALISKLIKRKYINKFDILFVCNDNKLQSEYLTYEILSTIAREISDEYIENLFSIIKNGNDLLKAPILRIILKRQAMLTDRDFDIILELLDYPDEKIREMASKILKKAKLDKEQIVCLLLKIKKLHYEVNILPFPAYMNLKAHKELVLSFILDSDPIVQVNGFYIMRGCDVQLDQEEIQNMINLAKKDGRDEVVAILECYRGFYT